MRKIRDVKENKGDDPEAPTVFSSSTPDPHKKLNGMILLE
jgi:hypothetical protein